MFDKHGQMGGGVIAGVVLLIIGIILMVGVAFPIVVQVVSNQSLTGVNKTIGDNLGTFVLLGALILIAGVAFLGFGRK